MTTTEIEARLAAAVTNEKAKAAIWDAVNEVAPTAMILPEHIQAASWLLINRANRLLSGDPAGWIGVGVLMVPDDFNWEVSRRGKDQRTTAELWRPVKLANDARPWHFHEAAKRPDCALCLAALRSRRGGDDNGQR